MIAVPSPRAARLRRSLVMIVTIIGAILAVPVMLMLLIVRLGGDR